MIFTCEMCVLPGFGFSMVGVMQSAGPVVPSFANRGLPPVSLINGCNKPARRDAPATLAYAFDISRSPKPQACKKARVLRRKGYGKMTSFCLKRRAAWPVFASASVPLSPRSLIKLAGWTQTSRDRVSVGEYKSRKVTTANLRLQPV